MSKPAAQDTTPQTTNKVNSNSSKDPKAVFIGAVLSMSWQLAIVVLVPIVGGYKLDQHFNTLPALTIIGFFVAMAGMFAVLKRILDELERQQTNSQKGGK